MTLRVLHVGKYFVPHFGGIESFMSELMKQQKSQGLKVAAIVHADKTEHKVKKYQWFSCDIYPVKSYGQLIFAPIAPLYPVRLIAALREFKPDVVHVHMPNLSAFWLLVLHPLLSRQSSLVVHWHSDVLGAEPTKLIRLFYPVYRVFESMLLNSAKRIIATSPPYLDTSIPLQRVIKKCDVVPLGIHIEKTDLSSKSSLEDTTLRLCMIGRLAYYKGHALLLKAIAALKCRNIQVAVEIIGDGELKETLQQECDRLDITDRVVWLGSVGEQEKRDVLRRSDMLLLPSLERTEAFGVVLLEAAEFSLPALVSSVEGSGMTFVVEHEKTGLVVLAGNIEDLQDKITFASQNKKRLTQMGEAAFQKLQNSFNLSVISRQITKIYRHE